MKPIGMLYFNLIQKVQSVKSIYEIVFLNVMIIVFTLLSYASINTALSLWSSVFAGFTFGIVLVKLPAGITYLKKGHKNDLNQS